MSCGTTGHAMGIEHGLAEAAARDPLPRHDGAGAAYGLSALLEGDDEAFQSSPIDEDRLQQLVVSLVDTQAKLLAGALQRVDANNRHHRARGSHGKTLAHFTVDAYVLLARVSRQGKQRKLMST